MPCMKSLESQSLPSRERRAESNVEPPSKYWQDVTPAAQQLVDKRNWDFLCNEAARNYGPTSTHHNTIDTSDSSCTVNLDKCAWGISNTVFELQASDGTFLVARIRHDKAAPETTATEMLSEIATLRIVAARTSIPVPTVYAFNTNQQNAFGYAYMIMDALPGKHLDDPFPQSVPPSHQQKFASQLADYLWQMSQLRFDEIGRIWSGEGLNDDPRIIAFQINGELAGPFNSSRDWVLALQRLDNETIAALHKDKPEWQRWQKICEAYHHLAPRLVSEDHIHGPFPLCHVDFHYANLLVDDELNITGVLDWTRAQTAPIERLFVQPDLMTFPALSEEENRPSVILRELVTAAYKALEQASSIKASNKQSSSEEGTTPAQGNELVSLSKFSDILDSILPEAMWRWMCGSVHLIRRNELAVEHLTKLLCGRRMTVDDFLETLAQDKFEDGGS